MTDKPIVFLKEAKKECGGCTACCSGALSGDAYGHEFYRGRPCFFVTQKGCGIYESRPDTPCKSFKCAYLTEAFFPEWMRPDISGALATPRVHKYTEKVKDGDKEVEVERLIPYMLVVSHNTTAPMAAKTLFWFVQKYFEGLIPNLMIDIEGRSHRIGKPDFMAARI